MRVSDYVGAPYITKGRGPDGYDCWGLVRDALVHVYGRTPLPALDDDYVSAADSRVPDLIEYVIDGIQAERVHDPEPGDIVLMVVWGRVQHVGIYVGGDRVLHIERGLNACIERVTSLSGRGRVIHGYYRV